MRLHGIFADHQPNATRSVMSFCHFLLFCLFFFFFPPTKVSQNHPEPCQGSPTPVIQWWFMVSSEAMQKSQYWRCLELPTFIESNPKWKTSNNPGVACCAVRFSWHLYSPEACGEVIQEIPQHSTARRLVWWLALLCSMIGIGETSTDFSKCKSEEDVAFSILRNDIPHEVGEEFSKLFKIMTIWSSF